MNEEEVKNRIRMAVSLIQEAKNQLSPMNDESVRLWNLTCDLELVRMSLDSILLSL